MKVKTGSLKHVILRWSVIGFLMSLAVFIPLYKYSSDVIDLELAGSSFVIDKERKPIKKLQKYITQNHLSLGNTEDLQDWAFHNGISELIVYKHNDSTILLDFRYDVMTVYRNGFHSYLSGATRLASIPTNFADGTYDVYVDTGAAGRIYMLVFAIELFLCFLIWMFILTRGMRGIIRRIMVLDKDVSGMENGDLTSAITVPGNDEVARLGKSIDNSRKALLANMQKEQREAEEKKEYIRTVTHDLRTPLTVILANLELVEHAENLTESRRFLKSTEQNAASLRDMITELFDFTITESLESIQLSGPAEAEAALGDDLSNLITLLHEDHFQTGPDTMTFPNRRILYEPSYISHIMTDILSNIRKYAVPESVIHIDLEENDENVVLTVMNPIAKTAESRQGTTHLGVRNIQEMMRLMHGTCECRKDPDAAYYTVRLAFPVAGN